MTYTANKTAIEEVLAYAASGAAPSELRVMAFAELDDLRKERDALSLALCDLNDGCVRLEKENATLRAHSAALRTIAEKAPADWWKRGTYTHEWGLSFECVGCEVTVQDDGTCAHATAEDAEHWGIEPCWAAPIIAMMEGVGET